MPPCRRVCKPVLPAPIRRSPAAYGALWLSWHSRASRLLRLNFKRVQPLSPLLARKLDTKIEHKAHSLGQASACDGCARDRSSSVEHRNQVTHAPQWSPRRHRDTIDDRKARDKHVSPVVRNLQTAPARSGCAFGLCNTLGRRVAALTQASRHLSDPQPQSPLSHCCLV
jgi:hypothetical protein